MSRKFVGLFVFLAVFGVCVNAYAEGDAAKGAESYAATCASCHGDAGRGDGVAAAALDPKPKDLSDSAYVSGLSDEHLVKVISEGGAAVGKSALMPAWGGMLSEQDVLNVVAYIRSDLCKCQAK